MDGDYAVDRKYQEMFCTFCEEELGMGDTRPHMQHYEDDTFIVRPYYWGDEEDDDYEERAGLPNFEHKPSGFKMWWYKYALRGSFANMPVDYKFLSNILYGTQRKKENE